jgi:hypothetical protein
MIARTSAEVVMQRIALVVALGVIAPVTLIGDVLVMRDGNRVQGELVSVRNGVIEFEERRGFGSGRTLRVNRDEVVRIEFDTSQNDDRSNLGARGRPAGLRERQVIVSADVPWNDTGIDVRAGQTLFFESSGNVRWGRDRRDGPEGESNSPPNAGRPMANRPAAALIGRIGANSNDFFFIGADQSGIRARSTGRLFLGVNDDFLPDNTGNFRVIVHY